MCRMLLLQFVFLKTLLFFFFKFRNLNLILTFSEYPQLPWHSSACVEINPSSCRKESCKCLTLLRANTLLNQPAILHMENCTMWGAEGTG